MSGSIRRRLPWWVLALVFVVVPVLEIYVLIQIGQVIGAWWTVLLLIADGFLGSWLMKREGARAWAALRVALESGRMPTRELADGALILVGGTLLVTPGFLSDVAGLFCVLPLTRPLARRVLTRFLTRRLLAAAVTVPGVPGATVPGATVPGATVPGTGPGTAGSRTGRRPGPDSVVQGEVVD